MGVQYNGVYSITFLKKYYNYYPISDVLSNYKEYHDKYGLIKNTWNDWKLIPAIKPIILPPLKKRNVLELPGNDGSINLTGFISNKSLYSNRTGSLEFYIFDKNLSNLGHSNLNEVYSDILNFFKDNEIMAILYDDKFYYYEGDFWVSSINLDKTIEKIVINYDIYPYKKAIVSTYDNYNWLWDPFDFNTGYIQESYDWTSNIVTNGSTMTIICGDKPQIIKLYFSFWKDQSTNIIIDIVNKSIKNNKYISPENYSIPNGTSNFYLTNTLSNTNVEKTITFSNFSDGGNVRVEVEYIGGFL